ncbi:MAG: hypothetical protein DCC71_02210 [Proteobacteria bacterium]|nr:MAG: hypothetical protein DCC71_02210 [Pseudomonadota bacterium]
MSDKPCVFVHTNHRQYVGALVSQYSMRRNSKSPDAFDVRILHTQDHAFLRAREGQSYLRGGEQVVWRYEDLQSFTPLRFLPPEAMGYRGRAVVVDPDVFAVQDVFELLSRDMQGKSVLCRPRTGSKGLSGCLATSVMLLDCAKLTHWNVAQGFDELFEGKRDYMDWICLKLEPRETVGLLEDEWNDFDRLTPRTKMIHNTKRHTQPWKTGLPADFRPAPKGVHPLQPSTWLRPVKRLLQGSNVVSHYAPHPDPNQERFFFGLLRECVEKKIVTEEMLREEMRRNHIRHDAFEVLERTPPLAA